MKEATMPKDARLDGQVAVISGAGRGIGRAAAQCLARAGARTILVARTSAHIEAACEAIRAGGGQAKAIAGDVSVWSDMARLADQVISMGGPPHIVVANAGIIDPVGDTWTLSPEDWSKNLAVNLTGAFHMVRAFLPSMIEAGRGVLIMTSSGAAAHPVAGWSAYCAAKAGLDHLGRTLAVEIRKACPNLRVHLLYPGIVDTAIQERLRLMPAERLPEVEKFRAYQRLGLLRPPEEPAALIWWLATPFAWDYHGRVAALDDPEVRRRMALDLGLPLLRPRGTIT